MHPGGVLGSLPQNIAGIEFNTMHLQKSQKLSLEIPSPVVCWLIFNIGNRPVNLPQPDGEGTIAFLPAKLRKMEFLVHPARRAVLDFTHGVSQGDGWRQRKKKVYMVFHTANLQAAASAVTRNTTHEIP